MTIFRYKSAMCSILTAGVMLFSGCGGTAVPGNGRQAKPPSFALSTASEPVKMRHQILFSSPEREDVFEGFMVLFDDAFYVKAFAGPGVALFTVAREGQRRKDTLHIAGLSDRIDIERVGSDINRIYLVGCNGDAVKSGARKCMASGEHVEEKYDCNGNLVSKMFPDAHRIGLTVTYEGYDDLGGRPFPKKISLRWGSSENRMVIHLVSAEPGKGDEAEVLKTILEIE